MRHARRFAVLVLALVASLGATMVSAQTLRVGLSAGDINQLDPVKSSQTQDVTIMDAVFNAMVRFQPGSANPANIEPDLAERWEASDDGLVWTFFLRPGVQFHGGFGTLTAEDVVFSLSRAANPDVSAFSSDYAAFAAVEALDELTVRITLSRPVPSLLGLVANYHGGLIVSKAAVEQYGDAFGQNPVGTGPFAFEAYRPQESVTLSAFAEHFRGAPALDGIVFRYLPDTQSRQLAFENGELDIVYGRRDQLWVEQMSQMEDTIVDVIGLGETRILHMNMTREPLDDLRVRQAIAHAVSKEEIQAFLGADIAVLESSPVPAGYMGHTDDVATYPHDTERAKSLLAEAGYPNGVDLGVVYITEVESLRRPMEIIQAQLARSGIAIQLEVIDHSTWHQRIREDASALVLYGAGRFPVADIYLTQFFAASSIVGTPTAVTNFSHYGGAIPGIDIHLDAANAAGSDQDARIAAWQDAQRQIMEDLPGVPLYTLKLVIARRANVELGYEMDSSMTLFYPILPETTIR